MSEEKCSNGHNQELMDKCIVCGAPQCCPICCREVYLENKIDELQSQLSQRDQEIENMGVSLIENQPTIHKTADGDAVWTECFDCGVNVAVDEDGCCSCGRDALRSGKFSEDIIKLPTQQSPEKEEHPNQEPKWPYIYQPYGMQNEANWKSGRIYAVSGMGSNLIQIKGLKKREAELLLEFVIDNQIGWKCCNE